MIYYKRGRSLANRNHGGGIKYPIVSSGMGITGQVNSASKPDRPGIKLLMLVAAEVGSRVVKVDVSE